MNFRFVMGGGSSVLLTAVEQAANLLSDKFSKIKVNQKALTKAESALAKVRTSDYTEKLVHDITTGLVREDLMAPGGFADIVVDILQLENEKQKEMIKKKIEILKVSRNTQSHVEEVKMNTGKYSSIYGFLAGITDTDGTVTVVYAFHKLEFSFPSDQNPFTADEVAAIKDHYSKKKALTSLKQEGIIKEISYEG